MAPPKRQLWVDGVEVTPESRNLETKKPQPHGGPHFQTVSGPGESVQHETYQQSPTRLGPTSEEDEIDETAATESDRSKIIPKQPRLIKNTRKNYPQSREREQSPPPKVGLWRSRWANEGDEHDSSPLDQPKFSTQIDQLQEVKEQTLWHAPEKIIPARPTPHPTQHKNDSGSYIDRKDLEPETSPPADSTRGSQTKSAPTAVRPQVEEHLSGESQRRDGNGSSKIQTDLGNNAINGSPEDQLSPEWPVTPVQKESKPHALTAEALVNAIGTRMKPPPGHLEPPSEANFTPIKHFTINETLDKDQESFWDIERDPRAELPDEVWEQQDWNATRRPKENRHKQEFSDDESLDSDPKWDGVVPSVHQRFLKQWVKNVHEIKATFLEHDIDRHEECDVDTETGVLMKSVDYPSTRRCHEGTSTYARFNMSSQSHIDKRLANLLEKRRLAKRKAEKRAAAIAWNREPTPEPEEVKYPYTVRVPCHLRPAYIEDLAQVTAIYNQEVEYSYKLIDTEPVPAEKFELLFKGCCRQGMPFVVAVEDWWTGGRDPNAKVIGFAFVDAVQRGIMGSYSTHARAGGKLTAVVHREYRRKKIGTALLDVIFTVCSTRYSSKQGYQFVNPHQDRRFFTPVVNVREWMYLDMEVHIKSGLSEEAKREEDEFKWIWNYLEDRFALYLVSYGFKLLRDIRILHKDGGWIDKLVFRHKCRSP